MAKFTLLEIHLDDARLTANAPFSGGEDGEANSTTRPEGDRAAGTDEPATEESGSGFAPGPVTLVAALVVALVAVAVLRRLIGGGDVELPDRDRP